MSLPNSITTAPLSQDISLGGSMLQCNSVQDKNLVPVEADCFVIEEINLMEENIKMHESFPDSEMSDTRQTEKKMPCSRAKLLKKKKNKLDKTLDAASAIQQSLNEKNIIKKEYYKNKIEQMTRQTDTLESIAKSIAAKANPYI